MGASRVAGYFVFGCGVKFGQAADHEQAGWAFWVEGVRDTMALQDIYMG